MLSRLIDIKQNEYVDASFTASHKEFDSWKYNQWLVFGSSDDFVNECSRLMICDCNSSETFSKSCGNNLFRRGTPIEVRRGGRVDV